MSTLDVRPAGFNLLLPPGGATIEVVAGDGQLAGTSLAMWLQERALAVPDVEQAVATAQLDDSDIGEDRVSFTLGGLSELDQGEFYRVIIADGDEPWCNGLARVSNDGTAAQSTTLTVTVASGTITLDISAGGGAGGTGLPAGTAGQMFRIGSDGETVEAVSPNAPGSWLRLNENGHVPDTQLAANIVRESEMDTAIATKGRDIYQPGLVMSPAAVSAFGGSMVNGVSVTIAALGSAIPVGVDILIWNGTAGAAPNGSYTHAGSGTFTYSARQYLNTTSVANGCVEVQGGDYYTDITSGPTSTWAITTADGNGWGLTPIGGYASDVTLIDGYTDQHHDALTAAKYATDPPAAWFVFSGNQPTNDAWTTGDIPELTGMPDMRALIYFERDAVEEFSEILTRWFDADGAAEDSPELAIYKPTPNAQPRIYVESVRDGGTTDESDINVEFDLEGVWMPIRAFYNSTGTLCTAQVGVRWDGDSTTSGRHTEWRTIATAARPAGIEWNVANDWIMGLHFEGRIAWVELYDGADGTLVAAPDAADWTTGTSFTDSEGNTWATTTGTVQSSLVARVDALDTAVAARVPTTRTLAGLDLSANRTAAALRTALGVAPAPSLLVAGQYSPSSKIAPTTTGLTNNRLYYVPRLIPRDITISRIAVNQAATGSAGAGSVGKFGVYNSASDLPASSFDLPAGTIDLTTGTGLKYVSGTWVLTAGIWWFAFVAQVTSGSPTFSTAPPDIAVPSNDGTNNGTKFENGVTGTLPATATPGAANTTGAPIIYLYV